jgi:aspartate racemase
MSDKTLGIVGGLGPLASSEFVKTIYEYNVCDCEQLLPSIILFSDPGFPDRTETLLSRRHQDMLELLAETLYKLIKLDVSDIVICCLTIHHLLSELPPELQRKVISLVDVIMLETLKRQRSQLLLCTRGARKLGVFQSHPWWDLAEEFIVFPDEPDQETIHSLIYRVKKGEPICSLLPVIEALLSKYRVESFIAGCTELHLFAKHVIGTASQSRGYGCIDPLITIAVSMPNLGSISSLAKGAFQTGALS